MVQISLKSLFKSTAAAAGFLFVLATGAQAAQIYGVTASNELVSFSSFNPGAVTSIGIITGLVGGDRIIGIDFRPANTVLYGLGSGNRVYTINTNTGVATQESVDGGLALTNTNYGFDWNPMVDRLRITGDGNQNLAYNPNTGVAAVQAAINPSSAISGVAYTNNIANAPSTILYGIDHVANTLLQFGTPALGNVTTVGTGLGFDVSPTAGFDIASTGIFASSTLGGITNLYSISLGDGTSNLVGAIGAPITSLAIAPIPEPGTIALLGAGLGALVFMRRRKK